MVLTPQQRRQRNRQDVIDTILQTARDIMREQGVAALTLNEIARRMKMRPPSLYEYFPNKMAIYDRLFQLGAELFEQKMRVVSERYPVPNAAELEDQINLYIQFAIDHPELFKLLFERHVPGFVPSEASMTAMYKTLELGASRTQHILSLGNPPNLSLQQVQDCIIAIMHGLAALHLANNPDAPLGQGRFGSLVPVFVSMLKQTWEIKD